MLLVSNPENHCQNQHQGACPLFSSRSYMVSSLKFVFNPFWVGFCIWSKWSGFISLHVAVEFFQLYLLKGLSFPHHISWLLCCKLIEHKCMGLFVVSLFCSVDLYIAYVTYPYVTDHYNNIHELLNFIKIKGNSV